jgi:hypothetical protein
LQLLGFAPVGVVDMLWIVEGVKDALSCVDLRGVPVDGLHQNSTVIEKASAQDILLLSNATRTSAEIRSEAALSMSDKRRANTLVFCLHKD